MSRTSILATLAVCLLLAPALAQSASAADRGFAWMNPRIVNKVEDLLDEQTTLDSVDGPTVWESESFDTSQFNRIGLRFTLADDSGWVTCRVCWQFSPEDTYEDGVPTVARGQFAVNDVDPFIPGSSRQRLDGIRDIYPIAVTPYADFTEVRGLSAKVRCYLGGGDFGQVLGDDPSLDPGGLEQIESSAGLEDVKVLLRRD